MHVLARLSVICALFLCAPAHAQAPGDLAGLYVANVRETATAIELTADGRFAWFFSTGALDMRSEGRWTRTAEGDVLLDSDPPVVPPSFELIRVAEGRRGGVAVGLARGLEAAAVFLDVEAEYADGERVYGRFEGLECRFPSDPARPVVAVRLGSTAFGFQSDPFPVPAAGARLIFRFIPNDLGIEDFRGQRVAAGPSSLRLDWRGMVLRYERTDPDLPIGSVDAITDPGPSEGLVDVRLGEPFEEMAARSTFDFGPALGGQGVIDLQLRFGDRHYDAGAVGGADYLPWMIDRGMHGRIVTSVRFSHQDRLIALDVALERARTLLAWLEQGGFAPGGADFDPEPAPFTVSGTVEPDLHIVDWDMAERLLAQEEAGIRGMRLYVMRAGDWIVDVSLDNIRRMSTDEEGRAYIRTEPGLEWRLDVNLFMEPSIVSAVDFPAIQR